MAPPEAPPRPGAWGEISARRAVCAVCCESASGGLGGVLDCGTPRSASSRLRLRHFMQPLDSALIRRFVMPARPNVQVPRVECRQQRSWAFCYVWLGMVLVAVLGCNRQQEENPPVAPTVVQRTPRT